MEQSSGLSRGGEPGVVNDARGVALFVAALASLFAVLAIVVTVGALLDGKWMWDAVSIGAASVLVAVPFWWLRRELRRRNATAWKVQTILSFVGLLAFPVGTLVFYSILRKWFTPEVRTWFAA